MVVNRDFRHDVELGRLITNLHSLELVLRDFLLTNAEGLEKSRQHAQSLKKMRTGQYVAENPFTNFDNLKRLIDKYNKRVVTGTKGYVVDEKIVKLRDAIAHGRAFAYGPDMPMLLMKFSPPKEGMVKVEFSAVMTIDWFDKQIKWVKRELDKVIEAYKLLSQGKL